MEDLNPDSLESVEIEVPDSFLLMTLRRWGEVPFDQIDEDDWRRVTRTMAIVALHIERHIAIEEALVMVRDADDDCKRDGLPTIPGPARAKIDKALSEF